MGAILIIVLIAGNERPVVQHVPMVSMAACQRAIEIMPKHLPGGMYGTGIHMRCLPNIKEG